MFVKQSKLALMSAAMALAVTGAAHGQDGLPDKLPANLPADLLLSPWDAEYVWIRQQNSNDNWNSNFWRRGADIEQWFTNQGQTPNSIAIQSNQSGLFSLPNPGIPNAPGATMWVGTANPGSGSGNDNINVASTFTVGQLTVQNISVGAGRSFRNGGTIIMDSGDPNQNARIVHLGRENDNFGDDMNIRTGTNLRLDSDTELYLLVTTGNGPRFRTRGSSQITGTGDLILNPGTASFYTGSATGEGDEIRREIRMDDSSRIATTGHIYINAARIRITDQADIINTSGITISQEGQLRLDRFGEVTYDLGSGPITINSDGHRMDDASNGAIRQQGRDSVPGSINDIGTVTNEIVVAGESRLHARNLSTLRLTGNLSGPGAIRKTGPGFLVLEGENTHGDTLVTNGTLVLSGSVTGSVSVDTSDSTLTGTGVVGSNLFVSSGATLAPGNSAGTLTVNGSVILSGSNSTTWLEIDGTAQGEEGGHDFLDIGNNFNLGGTRLRLTFSTELSDGDVLGLYAVGGNVNGDFSTISFDSTSDSPYGSGTMSSLGDGLWISSEFSNGQLFEFNSDTGQLTVIPEPSAIALLGLGGLAILSRRRRQQASGRLA
jgi:autotransporter-associated beta strand protein